MRTIELVTHCWRYSRVLSYQLSSLFLYPALAARISVGVFYSPKDAPTSQLVRYWERHLKNAGVTLLPFCTDRPNLLRREICRNDAALTTDADLVWFVDCDYVFGNACLETLATIDLPNDKLFFPRWVYINKTHALGDAYAYNAETGPGVYHIDSHDFEQRREKKAIGGLQIVPGDVARQYGYCRDDKKLQSPVTDGKWQVTKGDALMTGTPKDYKLTTIVNPDDWIVLSLGGDLLILE